MAPMDCDLIVLQLACYCIEMLKVFLHQTQACPAFFDNLFMAVREGVQMASTLLSLSQTYRHVSIKPSEMIFEQSKNVMCYLFQWI